MFKNRPNQLERKIRVGAVSYLNTKPLIYGFEQGMMSDQIELSINYPSQVAQRLLSGDLDIGLVPVAVLPQLKEYHIISDYCISCDGPVASVCLFSEVPLNEITDIFLDYQSMTSVALLKILLKEHWKINPKLNEASAGYESKIKHTTAGLVIGDRALQMQNQFAYTYDLGQSWKELTGLPFVFAVWVSREVVSKEFTAAFNQANLLGLNRISEISRGLEKDYFDIFAYYTKSIQFIMNINKMDSLHFFLNQLVKPNQKHG